MCNIHNIHDMLKNRYENIPYNLQNRIVNEMSVIEFYIYKNIWTQQIYDKYSCIYETSALKIQRFLKKRVIFEYGRRWRFVSWNYLKNHPDKIRSILCSISGKQWKPIDLLSSHIFCFIKSGGCSFYPRTVFFCSCPNGECLDHLEPFVFTQSVKIIL